MEHCPNFYIHPYSNPLPFVNPTHNLGLLVKFVDLNDFHNPNHYKTSTYYINVDADILEKKIPQSLIYHRKFPALMDRLGTLPVRASLAERSQAARRNSQDEHSRDDDSLQENLKLSKRAYEKRNVYKSIIRHAFKHIRSNREVLVDILRKEGFALENILEAFDEIENLVRQENEKGKPKNAKKALEQMIESKCICAYILRESLRIMIENWNTGTKGKILRTNVQIYKEVCQDYHDRILDIISKR